MGGTVRAELSLAEGRWRERPLGDDRQPRAASREAVLPVPRRRHRSPCSTTSASAAARPAARACSCTPRTSPTRSASLRTDRKLLRRFRADAAAACSSPRARASTCSPPARRPRHGHRRPGAHELPLPPAAASPRDIRRRYGALDALAVLTEADAATTRRRCAGATRVGGIPNAVPPLGGGRGAARARVVVAAGRLESQKGFDLLIAAWERGRRGAPGLAAADLRLRPAARRPAPP